MGYKEHDVLRPKRLTGEHLHRICEAAGIRSVSLTIAGVDYEMMRSQFSGEEEPVWMIRFEELEQPAKATLSDMGMFFREYGSDTDLFVGHVVSLEPVLVKTKDGERWAINYYTGTTQRPTLAQASVQGLLTEGYAKFARREPAAGGSAHSDGPPSLDEPIGVGRAAKLGLEMKRRAVTLDGLAKWAASENIAGVSGREIHEIATTAAPAIGKFLGSQPVMHPEIATDDAAVAREAERLREKIEPRIVADSGPADDDIPF